MTDPNQVIRQVGPSPTTLLQNRVYQTALDHGWWEEIESEKPETYFPEKFVLIHSEISEAVEAWREGQGAAYLNGDKPDGWAVELADCVIRIMDLLAHEGLDLGALINAKDVYNQTRPHRHGGKRI